MFFSRDLCLTLKTQLAYLNETRIHKLPVARRFLPMKKFIPQFRTCSESLLSRTPNALIISYVSIEKRNQLIALWKLSANSEKASMFAFLSDDEGLSALRKDGSLGERRVFAGDGVPVSQRLQLTITLLDYRIVALNPSNSAN